MGPLWLVSVYLSWALIVPFMSASFHLCTSGAGRGERIGKVRG